MPVHHAKPHTYIYTYIYIIYIYTFIYFPCAAAANMAMTMLHLHASMVFFPTENKEIPWKCWKLSDWHPVSCLKRLQCLSLQLSSGEISENEVGRPLNEVLWAGKWWGKRESQPGNIMWQVFALKASWNGDMKHDQPVVVPSISIFGYPCEWPDHEGIHYC